jgi:hypothetical protein
MDLSAMPDDGSGYTTRPKYLSDAVAADDVETLKLYLARTAPPAQRRWTM